MRPNIFFFAVASIVRFSYAVSVPLIKDYVQNNYLSNILMITCENQYQKHNIDTIILQHNGVWINFLDISNESLLIDFDYDKFFVRLSYSLCIVISLDCNNSNSFMEQMSKRTLFHYERYWLMFGSSVNRSFNILNRQNINVDAEIVLAVARNDSESTHDIYEVFNPSSKRGGQLNITKLGIWNIATGFNIPLQQTKIERRRNLQGIIFPGVITVRNLPNGTTYLEHLNSNNLEHINSISKLNYRLFLLIMDMYNFKVHVRVASLYAYIDDTGKWHGAIGMVIQNEVDFSLISLRWENDRYGVIEHTTHSYHVQVLFIFRHPKTIDAANVFLSPFTNLVWYGIISLALLSIFVLRNLFLIENQNIMIEHDRLNEHSFSNSSLIVFGFIFQQSYFGNPYLSSSRILMLTILVFSLLIFQFYSCFIVGSLLTEAPKNIKTIKQLMNSRITFGQDDIPYVIDNFLYAKEESTVQLYNQMMKNPEKVIMPLQTGLNLLKKGGFAFNTDGSYAYIILKNMLSDSEKCDLQEVKYIPKVPAAPVLPIKSAFRELIKISIRRITETGHLSYYNKMFYGTKPKCEISEVIVSPVDIVHFSSALYILLMGIVSSGTILLFEIAIDRYSRSKSIS